MFRSLILYTIDHKLNYFMRPIERGSFMRKSNRTDWWCNTEQLNRLGLDL